MNPSNLDEKCGFNPIIYLDNYFSVVLKQSGEICQTQDIKFDLAKIILPFAQKKLGFNLDFCQCVNRLDQPVTGLCVVAFNQDIFTKITSLFSEHKVKKTYLAIVEKTEFLQKKFSDKPWFSEELTGYIKFDNKKKKAFMVQKGKSEGKFASLTYEIIGEGDRYFFIKVEPKTGRTHQIRCQLAAEGMFIKGDLKYGAKRSEKTGGIRLHAWRLEFVHPVTNKSLCFTSPPAFVDGLWQACLDCQREILCAAKK